MFRISFRCILLTQNASTAAGRGSDCFISVAGSLPQSGVERNRAE
jgi:hypothetical protein